MKQRKILNQIRTRRKNRTRSKIRGTAAKPRLTVFRSNRFTYVQLIDDERGKTLAAASTMEINSKNKKLNQAELLGQLIAEKASKVNIKKIIFDRGSYAFHGRIKAVLEGARKKGLKV